jgi:hypothetical protein
MDLSNIEDLSLLMVDRVVMQVIQSNQIESCVTERKKETVLRVVYCPSHRAGQRPGKLVPRCLHVLEGS